MGLEVVVRTLFAADDAATLVQELFKHFLYIRNQSPCLIDQLLVSATPCRHTPYRHLTIPQVPTSHVLYTFCHSPTCRRFIYSRLY
jgi:hypothetical protein